MTQTLITVKQQIRNCLPALRDKFKVERIGVFGSVVRGSDERISDVDMLVRFSDSPGFFTFVKLESYLSGLLKRKVDLVTEQALKPILRETILQEVSYV